jgi:hypothetical protein
MKNVISLMVRRPLQFAVGSLLAVGLLVSAVIAMTPTSAIGSTKAPANANAVQAPSHAVKVPSKPGSGYGYSYKGRAKGHREHCPSPRGQQQSHGRAVCHIAPRHGR